MNPSKIRVLQIVPTLGYGGVAQFLLNYYKYMDKNQISFDFITHGEEEIFHHELINNGSKIFYLKSIGKVGLIGYLKQLKAIFLNNSFDIVHTHDGHLTGLTSMLCRRYYKGPILCHAHTTLCVNKKHRYLMPIFRWLSRHYGNLLLGCGVKACEYCFGTNASYITIHNAVSLEYFKNVSYHDIEVLKKKLNITDSTFVIGHIGVFTLQKNHDYILSVFDYLLKRHPDTVLVLIGDGELKSIIENKARDLGIIDNIRFEGIQKNIPLYMNLFDTFILPSLYEGLPVCGVEAQTVVGNVCFSDTIDKDVDVGIGSVSFIPIDKKALPEWEKAIFTSKNKPEEELVKKCFIEKGYEIRNSVETLFNIYKNVAINKK